MPLVALTACSAARDERTNTTTTNHAPVAHNTIVDCPVHDGMTKTSTILAQTTASSEVQVTDTINAYIRARAPRQKRADRNRLHGPPLLRRARAEIMING